MEYTITASVTSAPSDIALQLNNQNLRFTRNTTAGDWIGKANLNLSNPVDLNFRAVGLQDSPWTLLINIAPIDSNSNITTYHHNDVIPSDMLSIFSDQIIIK